MQMSDWGTVSARRARGPPEQGGLEPLPTSANAESPVPWPGPSTIMNCAAKTRKNSSDGPATSREGRCARSISAKRPTRRKQKALVEAMPKRISGGRAPTCRSASSAAFLGAGTFPASSRANTLVFGNREELMQNELVDRHHGGWRRAGRPQRSTGPASSGHIRVDQAS